MEIVYKPSFIKQVKRLSDNLKEEVLEKIEMFKSISNHKILKVHKLNGPYKNCYSFSVNYAYRIIFQHESKDKVVMLGIGDHDIYK